MKYILTSCFVWISNSISSSEKAVHKRAIISSEKHTDTNRRKHFVILNETCIIMYAGLRTGTEYLRQN